MNFFVFFFSSRRRHTRFDCDWSSDVCSSDLECIYRAMTDTLNRGLARLEVGPEHLAKAAVLDVGSGVGFWIAYWRSEEHTSELQSQSNLVCRLLLEKKKEKVGANCLNGLAG